jgi:hypothetical protein
MEQIMSFRRSLAIVSVVVGSFTFGTQAMALNPQPLPPRWSQSTITTSKIYVAPRTTTRGWYRSTIRR